MDRKTQAVNDQYPLIDLSTGRATEYFRRVLLDRGLSQNDTETVIAILETRQILGGTGIDGGGLLLDGDITLSANVQEILDEITTTQGSILYRGASAWSALGPGTSGQFLQTGGTGANPSWATPTGGSSAWTLVDQTGAAASGSSTWTWSTNVANVDVTGLSSYNELLVIVRNVTSSVSGVRTILLSVDNGSSFYSASGNYVDVVVGGTDTALTQMFNHGTNSTAARSVIGYMSNLKGPIKVGINSSGITRLFLASTSDVNAIRLTNQGGGNLLAGSLYVFAR